MSKKCAWYKKGKLREIFEFDPVEMSREDGNVVVEPGRRAPKDRSEDLDNPDEDEDELSTLYDFIEVCVPALDDEDDDREEEEDLSAGEVIFTDEKVHREWLEGRNGTTKLADGEVLGTPGACIQDQGDPRAYFQDQGGGSDGKDQNRWAPFQSEMDWRFASWAMQENIKLSSIDSALKIPGFQQMLGLSYHNSWALLQRVNSLPERAEWQEQWLTFKDRPNEKHLLQFRDIIQAICALLSNPEHADKIVY
ncbi:hypothetical protein FOMPIDRAFT_92644 [Fomitopsis schrenkii]|uniref:Uncharacterized protein n=1 Tax=Fomitopsis schrenkii TaxID=2126942 RepID=S8F4A1_FOMSC|nr:hypothetical protein FOMPIDRAFT_92644 [Fomitopsis schrenkii]